MVGRSAEARDRRSVSLIVLAAMIALLFLLTSKPAEAAFRAWGVDDDCTNINNPANPYFYAEGPAAYWHGDAYSGGPTQLGPSCMMWTYNTFSYVSVTYDNTSYWYLPISPPGTWSGLYGTWAFEPVPYASTRQAIYEWWPSGHVYTQPSGLCSFDQFHYAYNVYAQLCARTTQNPTWFFCADVNQGCGGFWRLTDATGESSFTTYVGSDDLLFCANASASSCLYLQSGLGLDSSTSWAGAQVPNLYSMRCLDADTNTIGNNGTKIQLWSCTGANNQHWNRDPGGNGGTNNGEMTNTQSGRCLDADLSTIGSNGTKIQLWNCTFANNQQWYTPGDGTIRNVQSGRCLDADLNTIGSNGTKVQLWDCNGGRNQQWLTVATQ